MKINYNEGNHIENNIIIDNHHGAQAIINNNSEKMKFDNEQYDCMEQICKVLNQKSQGNDEKKVAKEAEIIAQECKKTRNLSKFREFLKTNMKASTSSFLIGTLSSLASSAIWEFVIKAIIA